MILSSLFLRITITMYMTMRKTQNENRAIVTRLPNRAPTIAPAWLELLIEIELELLLAEVGSVEIGVVEALITETGLFIDAELAVWVVSHWPIIEQAIKHEHHDTISWHYTDNVHAGWSTNPYNLEELIDASIIRLSPDYHASLAKASPDGGKRMMKGWLQFPETYWLLARI